MTTSDSPIADRTGEQVRMICRNGCNRGRTVLATLKRSDRVAVQQGPDETPKKYAGHVAVCTRCGYEGTDFYNWYPPKR